MGRTSLNTLYNRFLSETATILDCFRYPLSRTGNPPNHYHSLTYLYSQEMCVIRLQDAWGRFCRELVVISASAQPLTASGNILSRAPKIRKRADVIPTLISTYRKKTNEPYWYIPTECIDASRRLNVANHAEISAGIGATPAPTDDLRAIRNYLAHRNKETADAVRRVTSSMGLPRNYSAIQIVTTAMSTSGSTTTVFENWVITLRGMAFSAVQ